MAWTDWLAGRFGYERRDVSPSWAALQPGGAAYAVTDRMAENLSTVSACVSAIATALASVPVYVYEHRAGNRTEVVDHPVAQLLRGQVNAVQTWPELAEGWIADTLLNGNGLIEISREGGGIAQLGFIPWADATPVLSATGRLAYDVTRRTSLYGETGRTRRLLAADVAHLKDRSSDGVLGMSRLARSASTVVHAIELNRRAQNVVANGAAPSGALSTEKTLPPETAQRLKDYFMQRHTGSDNAGSVLVLGDGMKFTPFEITPEDAELLASRKFGVEEICRLFQVPPPIVQDYSHNTFTNSTAAGRWFAQFTLGPWARKIEATLSHALFPEGSGLEVELDLSAFLRGDPETRWAAHKIAVEAGILTANEVREIEGFNPRPEGASTP